ncbi:MAG: hypothetical protein JO056_08285 [Alphaproteobacteria bacterium]|nr:hypothetical protein [Alphaproteobacteria bacterium]
MKTSLRVMIAAIIAGFASSAAASTIVNGDFEHGQKGFTSEYAHVRFCGPFGVFMISRSPAKVCVGNWIDFGDHTTGTGQMMIVDGSPNDGKIVWSETVQVVPDANYAFSYWGTSVDPHLHGLRASLLQVFINEEPIGSPRKMKSYEGWHKKTVRWNSGANTSATISLIDFTVQEGGNDFALDDIRFEEKSAAAKR